MSLNHNKRLMLPVKYLIFVFKPYQMTYDTRKATDLCL